MKKLNKINIKNIKISNTEYYCPKHGNIGVDTLSFRLSDGTQSKIWCLKCLIEFIDNNVSEVYIKNKEE